MVGTGPVRKAFQRVARQRGADSAWAEIETRIAEMTAELATLRAGDQPACLEALAEAKQAWEAAEAALKFAKDEAAEAWRRVEVAEARVKELEREQYEVAADAGTLQTERDEAVAALAAVQDVVDERVREHHGFDGKVDPDALEAHENDGSLLDAIQKDVHDCLNSPKAARVTVVACARGGIALLGPDGEPMQLPAEKYLIMPLEVE